MKTQRKFKNKSFIFWVLGSFFLLYQFLLQTSPSVMITPLSQDLNTTALGVSLLSSAYYYTYITLQIPAGMLVDRGNIRYIYTIGMGGLALTCLGFAFSHSLFDSSLFRVAMGVFAAPGLVGAFYIIDQWFFKRYFAFLVGVTEMFSILGAAIGQIILAQGVIHLGWRGTLIMFSITGLIVTLIGCTVLRERKQKKPLHLVKPIKALFTLQDKPSNSMTTKGHFTENLKRLLSLPNLWIASLVSGLAFATLSAFAGFWCIPFLQNNFHLGLGQAATASAAVFAGAATCTPFMGLITDKYKNKSTLIMAWVFFITTVLFIPLIFFPQLPLAIIIVLLVLIGMLSSVYVIPFTLAKKMAPPGLSATAMGLVNVLSILVGAPLLQPLIGAIIHFAQSLGASPDTSFTIGLSLFPLLALLAGYLSLKLMQYTQADQNSSGELNAISH